MLTSINITYIPYLRNQAILTVNKCYLDGDCGCMGHRVLLQVREPVSSASITHSFTCGCHVDAKAVQKNLTFILRLDSKWSKSSFIHWLVGLCT